MKYRHGDLLVHNVENPGGRLIAQHVDDNDAILLAGEATGHNHRLQGDFTLYRSNNNAEEPVTYFQVNSEANLNHEEHGFIALPKGFYAVVRQREYTPEGIQYVYD